MEKLRALRLETLGAAWAEQQKNPEMQKLSFDERLGMLIDAEWLHRANKRLARALKEAKLRIGNACIEDIDYPPRRELEKATIRQLATCRWVTEHQNVVITGMTGTGKTYVACALAEQACRKGYRAVYRRATRLNDELTLARADGTYALSSSPASLAPTSSSSTTGASRRRRTRSAATSSRSSKTGTTRARPSSRARSRPRSGTTTSATRRWPTPSATGSSTTPPASY
jgi:hypothetical protein